jgi:hypothetical protein
MASVRNTDECGNWKEGPRARIRTYYTKSARLFVGINLHIAARVTLASLSSSCPFFLNVAVKAQ